MNFYAPQIMSLKYLVRFWIPEKYVTGQLFLLLRNKLKMVDRIVTKHLRRHNVGRRAQNFPKN